MSDKVMLLTQFLVKSDGVEFQVNMPLENLKAIVAWYNDLGSSVPDEAGVWLIPSDVEEVMIALQTAAELDMDSAVDEYAAQLKA